MIDLKIYRQWYDCWANFGEGGWKQPDDCFSAHVSENMKISISEYRESFHLDVDYEQSAQEPERRYNCGNRGIYDGANCRQIIRFCDGDTIIKEFKIRPRPGKAKLLEFKPILECWLEHAKQLTFLNNIE